MEFPANARFVSLGSNCTVRYQVLMSKMRFLFGEFTKEEYFAFVKQYRNYGLDEESTFFDWRVTPFETASRLISTNFEGVFERKNLKAISGVAEDLHTRMGFNHLFDRQDGSELTEDFIDQRYEDEAQKVFYLRDKFMQMMASDVPLVFVQWGWSTIDQIKTFLELPVIKARGGSVNVIWVTLDDAPLVVDVPQVTHRRISKAAKAIEADTIAFGEHWKAVLDPIVHPVMARAGIKRVRAVA